MKAANTRSLVPYGVELQRRAVAIDASASNKHMLKVLESLQAAYDLLYSCDYFLTPEQADTDRQNAKGPTKHSLPYPCNPLNPELGTPSCLWLKG